MDVFALQEEIDNAKVARSSQARSMPRRDSTATQPASSPNGKASPPPECSLPPHLIRDEDTGETVTATPVHPHSSEYKLRQRYLIFTDDIIGRGAFGEVLLAQIREVPLIGNLTFAPLAALLSPQVMAGARATSRAESGLGGNAPQSPTVSQSASPSFAALNHSFAGAHSTGPSTSALSQPPSSASRSSYAAIHRASLSNDIPLFAVKKIDKSRTSAKGLSQLYSEVETLSLLSHSNIVRLQEVFQDESQMFIVMEYVRGGELGKVLRRVGHFSEPVTRKMCLNILLAIEYIHEKGIVHRDLKPANCLLTKETVFSSSTAFHFAQLHSQAAQIVAAGDAGSSVDASSRVERNEDRSSAVDTIAVQQRLSPSPAPSPGSSLSELRFTVNDFSGLKLADFGFAAMVGKAECLTTYCGTMHFMAPEVVGREGSNYGKPVDMWSFGVIAYNLLSGDLPFVSSSSDKLVDLICAGNVQFASSKHGKGSHHAASHRNANGVGVWQSVSPQAKDFIKKLLVVDPTKRLTAQEALRHPWIRSEYSEEDEVGDYPTDKGVLRAHSKWARDRSMRHRLLGVFQAVIAAHRFVFFARLQSMKREGIAEIPVLRHLPFIVHGTFEPNNHIASASSKKFWSNIPALKRLAEMVAASHTVEVLDVSGTNLDDLGLVQLIVKVSFSHPSLVHLNMERNPIPPLAARALLRLARSPTHKLNIINVNHTNLGMDVIAQIDGCLKETIRKRTEQQVAAAAAASVHAAAQHHPSIIASSSILRNDGSHRIGLMQSLTSPQGGASNATTPSGPTPTSLSTPPPLRGHSSSSPLRPAASTPQPTSASSQLAMLSPTTSLSASLTSPVLTAGSLSASRTGANSLLLIRRPNATLSPLMPLHATVAENRSLSPHLSGGTPTPQSAATPSVMLRRLGASASGSAANAVKQSHKK